MPYYDIFFKILFMICNFVICVEVARGLDLCIKWSVPFNFAISYNLFSLFIHDFVFLWFVLRLQGALIFASNDQPPFNFAISYNLFTLTIQGFLKIPCILLGGIENVLIWPHFLYLPNLFTPSFDLNSFPISVRFRKWAQIKWRCEKIG